MTKIKKVLMVFAVICLVSCAQVSITGSGNIVSQQEMITGFDKLDISSSFDVEITRGDSFQVVIRVDDNLLEHIQVNKQGSTLKIGLEPMRAYNISNATMEADITMPDLTALDLSGSSTAVVSGFETNNSLTFDLSGNSELRGEIKGGQANFDVSGNSRILLAGSAANLRISASGNSEVDLSDFPGTDGRVDASGSSTVIVNLSGRMDADASGGSDIFYLGNPQLGSIDTSGSSNIQPK